MNIILIGFKKSGKSTIGKEISKKINKTFLDMDDVIEDVFFKKYKEKKDVIEIYKVLKEEEFRILESIAYFETKDVDDFVIATSGGGILNDNIKKFSKPKIVFYLKASREILKNRIRDEKRSVFNENNFFESQYFNRDKLYQKNSDHILLVDNKDITKICDEITSVVNPNILAGKK